MATNANPLLGFVHEQGTNNQHRQPPPKPPDGGGVKEQQQISFRDKLLGSNAPRPRKERVYLIANKIVTIDFEGGDRLKPKCFIEESFLETLWEPWKEAIIVKLLGKVVSFFTMRDRLKAIWRLTGGSEIVDIGHGFYMVKLDLAVYREKVMGEGPWMMFDHYLAVRPWVPDFVSSDVKIDSTLVWIRFPCLGMEYYYESVLMALATAVGRPVKVDICSIEASRGKFARVCVEIGLDKPVVGRVWFRHRWQQVEYEGLHLLCKRCGVYEHVARNCTMQGEPPCVTVEDELAEGTNGAASQGGVNENPSANKGKKIIVMYGDTLVVEKGKNDPQSRNQGDNRKKSNKEGGKE